MNKTAEHATTWWDERHQSIYALMLGLCGLAFIYASTKGIYLPEYTIPRIAAPSPVGSLALGILLATYALRPAPRTDQVMTVLSAVICALSTLMLILVQLGGAANSGNWFWLIPFLADPEMAFAIVLVARHKLDANTQASFVGMVRLATAATILAFGVFSTLLGFAPGLQDGALQPVVGISVPMALILLVICLSEMHRMRSQYTQNVLHISVALSAVSYFCLTQFYIALCSGDADDIAIEIVIILALLFGLRKIATSSTSYFAMIGRMQQRNNDLRRKNAVVRDLLYALAHDLRAPVRGIVHASEWMREDLANNDIDAAADRNRLIAERGDILSKRLESIVEYARLGGFVASLHPFRFNTLIEGVSHTLPKKIRKNITLEGDDLVVVSDESAIGAILTCLLDNAARFADHDDPRVTLRWTHEADHLTFCVIDNGAGIDPALQSKLFQPFRTLGAPESQQGMGLAHCARICEALNGRISLLSDPRDCPGTEVRVSIPAPRSVEAAT